jgi:hypothetical protein
LMLWIIYKCIWRGTHTFSVPTTLLVVPLPGIILWSQIQYKNLSSYDAYPSPFPRQSIFVHCDYVMNGELL